MLYVIKIVTVDDFQEKIFATFGHKFSHSICFYMEAYLNFSQTSLKTFSIV